VSSTLTERIKREGGDRIADVLKDYETQLNILAYLLSLMLAERAGAVMTEQHEQQIFIGLSIQQWVFSMQAKVEELAANQDETYADDLHWPAPPAGSAEFIDKF